MQSKKETIDCWFIQLLIIRRNIESCFTTNCEIAFSPSISCLPRISNHITNVYTLNKSYIKPKWQSRMDSPERLATLGTQDTGHGQKNMKNQKTKTQHNKES